MRSSFFSILALPGAFASLNCTLTQPIKLYCCPDPNSEVITTRGSGDLVMLGCAADDSTNGRWFWNYNNLYTPTTKMVRDCSQSGKTYDNTDSVLSCKNDNFVMNLTKGHLGPLSKCDPQCWTNNHLPNETYFGDTVLL